MTPAPQTLDDALDQLDGSGVVEVEEARGRTKVDVVEADRLGVRIRSLQVDHERRDILEEAQQLPGRIRALPDRLVPTEVSPKLGGAILRTAPESIRRGRFFEVEVRPEHTGIKRFKVDEGDRAQEDFTLTRDQLRDLVDQVRGDPE